MRLKVLDCNCIDARKSCINVILQDHIGNCLFRVSELSGDVKQFSKVGIKQLTGSETKGAEFPKERHASDGVSSVGFQFFPHLNRIIHSFNVYLNSIGTGSGDDCQVLRFSLLV